MNNAEYRASRGTDHDFTTTPEESTAAWQVMNAEVIAKKKARVEAFGKRRKAWAEPELNRRGEEFNDE